VSLKNRHNRLVHICTFTTPRSSMPVAAQVAPINPVWVGAGAQAAYSGRGTSSDNDYYNMRRSHGGYVNPHVRDNMADYAARLGFDMGYLLLPQRWPHTGEAILAEEVSWAHDLETGSAIPELPQAEVPNAFDAVVTQARDFVVGVQGADCPPLFIHDPVRGIVAAPHCGNKPLGRGVIPNTLAIFRRLGSNPHDIIAHVGPGAGDDLYDFDFSETDRIPFAKAGRDWLLDDPRFRREFTPENQAKAQAALGRPAKNKTVLAMTAIALHDLEEAGILREHITVSGDSCILNPHLPSYRRDKGDGPVSRHGLFLGTIRLI
jgi:copper oxidase (laccase) domain-containing protein